jgi:hypothetical protein
MSELEIRVVMFKFSKPCIAYTKADSLEKFSSLIWSLTGVFRLRYHHYSFEIQELQITELR